MTADLQTGVSALTSWGGTQNQTTARGYLSKPNTLVLFATLVSNEPFLSTKNAPDIGRTLSM